MIDIGTAHALALALPEAEAHDHYPWLSVADSG